MGVGSRESGVATLEAEDRSSRRSMRHGPRRSYRAAVYQHHPARLLACRPPEIDRRRQRPDRRRHPALCLRPLRQAALHQRRLRCEQRALHRLDPVRQPKQRRHPVHHAARRRARVHRARASRRPGPDPHERADLRSADRPLSAGRPHRSGLQVELTTTNRRTYDAHVVRQPGVPISTYPKRRR